MVRPSRKAVSLTLGAAACIAIATYAVSTPSGGAATPGTAPTAQIGAPATPPATSPGAQSSMPAAQLSDAEIVGVVNAVDQHEIDAATKAMKEKMGKEAKDFAKMLKKAHTENMAKTKKVAKQINLKPATSAVADTLRAKGERDVKAMAALNGAEFEKAYIDAMVTGHTEVLSMLDTQLITNARNDTLKTHLTEVRGHVAAHLEQGKRLQGASAGAATPQ
jgi:putative membrane protein